LAYIYYGAGCWLITDDSNPLTDTRHFSAVPRRHALIIRWLLLTVLISLIIGLISPMMTMTKFYFIDSSFSVMTGVYELYLSGHYLLLVIITAFSIALPLLKIYVLFRLVGNHTTEPRTLQRYMHLMHEYGRWAMLDVMVVAVLIVTVKLGAVASIETHYGLYVFGTAVLLLMLITRWVVHLTTVKTEP